MVWRKLYDILHASSANLTAMVWAPFEGSGYPFPNETYSARPGNLEFNALDTNKDGKLDARDDPYAPYYPGDAYVDWVGLSLYYKGKEYPWIDNAVPRPGLFEDLLTGANSLSRANFYANYSASKGKPCMIAETGAVVHTLMDGTPTQGPDPLAIKSAWWRQFLTNTTFLNLYPLLKMFTLHEYVSLGSGLESGLLLDYSVTNISTVRESFLQDLSNVSSAYLFSNSWEHRVTFVREPNPPETSTAPKTLIPSWAIGLTLGLPLFIILIWGAVSLYRKHSSTDLHSDTSSVYKPDELVDDSATIINEDGILAPEEPGPVIDAVTRERGFVYPSSAHIDFEARHATL